MPSKSRGTRCDIDPNIGATSPEHNGCKASPRPEAEASHTWLCAGGELDRGREAAPELVRSRLPGPQRGPDCGPLLPGPDRADDTFLRCHRSPPGSAEPAHLRAGAVPLP